jgi:hypothetical protein
MDFIFEAGREAVCPYVQSLLMVDCRVADPGCLSPGPGS